MSMSWVRGLFLPPSFTSCPFTQTLGTHVMVTFLQSAKCILLILFPLSEMRATYCPSGENNHFLKFSLYHPLFGALLYFSSFPPELVKGTCLLNNAICCFPLILSYLIMEAKNWGVTDSFYKRQRFCSH